ncbi:MAG: hypothetical protein WCD89_04935 [Anaerocolumna sp.]
MDDKMKIGLTQFETVWEDANYSLIMQSYSSSFGKENESYSRGTKIYNT